MDGGVPGKWAVDDNGSHISAKTDTVNKYVSNLLVCPRGTQELSKACLDMP